MADAARTPRPGSPALLGSCLQKHRMTPSRCSLWAAVPNAMPAGYAVDIRDPCIIFIILTLQFLEK